MATIQQYDHIADQELFGPHLVALAIFFVLCAVFATNRGLLLWAAIDPGGLPAVGNAIYASLA